MKSFEKMSITKQIAAWDMASNVLMGKATSEQFKAKFGFNPSELNATMEQIA